MSKFIIYALTTLSLLNISFALPVEIIQGDIVVTKGLRAFGLENRKTIWPKGIVPYIIDPSAGYTSNEISLIKSSMTMLTQKSRNCITFVPKTSAHTNWITIRNYQGCYSNVGMNPYQGSQDISLKRGDCTYKGTIVHELMHAIGFWHEQNRPDRDQHIRINYGNIAQGLAYAFDINQGQTFSTPYDLKSIMQYYEYAFSGNGQKTIEPLNGEKLVPVFEKKDAQILTSNDIKAVRELYQCDGSVPEAITSEPEIPTKPYNEVQIVFYNDLPMTVKFYWVDFNKNEILYQSINSGMRTSQSTWVGHEWILRNVRGEQIGRLLKIAKEMDNTEIKVSSLAISNPVG